MARSKARTFFDGLRECLNFLSHERGAPQLLLTQPGPLCFVQFREIDKAAQQMTTPQREGALALVISLFLFSVCQRLTGDLRSAEGSVRSRGVALKKVH